MTFFQLEVENLSGRDKLTFIIDHIVSKMQIWLVD